LISEEIDLMLRKALQTMFVALVAVFALASVSVAAPQKSVKLRVRHSTKLTTGATKTRSTVKKKPAAKPRRATSKKTTKKSTSASRKTKPR